MIYPVDYAARVMCRLTLDDGAQLDHEFHLRWASRERLDPAGFELAAQQIAENWAGELHLTDKTLSAPVAQVEVLCLAPADN